MGLEPTRRDRHKILSLARLPIPTLPRTNGSIAKKTAEVNRKFSFLIQKRSQDRVLCCCIYDITGKAIHLQ